MSGHREGAIAGRHLGTEQGSAGATRGGACCGLGCEGSLPGVRKQGRGQGGGRSAEGGGAKRHLHRLSVPRDQLPGPTERGAQGPTTGLAPVPRRELPGQPERGAQRAPSRPGSRRSRPADAPPAGSTPAGSTKVRRARRAGRSQQRGRRESHEGVFFYPWRSGRAKPENVLWRRSSKDGARTLRNYLARFFGGSEAEKAPETVSDCAVFCTGAVLRAAQPLGRLRGGQAGWCVPLFASFASVDIVRASCPAVHSRPCGRFTVVAAPAKRIQKT